MQTSSFVLAEVPLELVEFAFHPPQQRAQAPFVFAQRRQDFVVVDGEERVDEGLLAFLLVVAAVQFRFQRDLAEEGEGEEQADDAAVDDEGGERVECRVGRQDDHGGG